MNSGHFDKLRARDFKVELDEEDRQFITQVFFEDVVNKLRRLHARIGTLNCGFAGEQYRKWNLLFRSKGPDFEIMDFEFDEDSHGFSLDP